MPSTVVMLVPSTDPTGHRQELMAVKLSLPGRFRHNFIMVTMNHYTLANCAYCLVPSEHPSEGLHLSLGHGARSQLHRSHIRPHHMLAWYPALQCHVSGHSDQYTCAVITCSTDEHRERLRTG